MIRQIALTRRSCGTLRRDAARAPQLERWLLRRKRELCGNFLGQLNTYVTAVELVMGFPYQIFLSNVWAVVSAKHRGPGVARFSRPIAGVNGHAPARVKSAGSFGSRHAVQCSKHGKRAR